MKKLFLFFLICTLHSTLFSTSGKAQNSFTPGYYMFKVVRSGAMMCVDRGLVSQNPTYTEPPTVLTTSDLNYIFKLELIDEFSSAYSFMNCQTKEYIVNPGEESVQLTTAPTNPGAFTPEKMYYGDYWGFYTTIDVDWYGTIYMQACYLNDLRSTGICIWRDGPDYDSGSQFEIFNIDASIVENLMDHSESETASLTSFVPERGATYTIYTRAQSGYAAANSPLTSSITDDNEFLFESAGVTSDNVPTFNLKHVKSGTYLQHVALHDMLDSSDTGEWTPYGDKATAGAFTIVRAMRTQDDLRAYSENFVDGEWVICDVETYEGSAGPVHTYFGAYAKRMFFSPWTDSNHLAIAKYTKTTPVTPQESEEEGDDQSVELWGPATDTLAIQSPEGDVLLIPDNMIKSREGGTIVLKGDSVVSGSLVETPVIDENFPCLRTFKLNNKYNDVLVKDIDGEVTADTVRLFVTGCIAKTLCPSFSLTEESVNVYHGNKRQLSHTNRNRFDKTLTYTLARPGYRILQVVKTQDEIWSEPSAEGKETPVTLTADQLSTNAPSGRDQGVDKLVDGNLDTYYHSTWTNDPVYTPLNYDRNNPNLTVWPYVEISLNKPLRFIKWGFVSTFYNRVPNGIMLQASDDGTTWKDIRDFTELPTQDSESYKSPMVDLGKTYSHLRLLLTAAAYKNYFCMRELYLYEIEPSGSTEPEIIQEAKYAYSTRPWGRDVKIVTSFATDLSTNVPRVDIDLDNATLSDIHYNKTTYFSGMFSIDGGGVFPDMEPTAVNMRGRGNSSWSASKKPYRLKFNEKVKPFGLTKGKSWCLIAQSQSGSMLSNPIALRVATMTGSAGANHAIPVELYVNGSYIGAYMFTENPGFGNNSVSIDETNAYLLELDTYYDETYRFQDNYYSLPVNIKEPDLTEETDQIVRNEKLSTIKSQFSAFTQAVKYKDIETYESMMDIDSWSRFMLVNDVVRNTELMHPKSVKLYREDMTNEDDKFCWGPAWDFDWAFGYEAGHSYYIADAESDLYNAIKYYGTGGRYGGFFYDIQNYSDAVQQSRYTIWTEFMNTYRDELMDYVSDYQKYANPSFLNNSTRWGDGKSYESNAENAQKWLKKRTDWVYSNMRAFDLPSVEYGLGDINEDTRVSVGDAICLVNRLLGLPTDVFNTKNADMNGDGIYSVGDLQLIVRAILDEANASAAARARMPRVDAELTITPFTVRQGEEKEVAVNLTTAELTAGLQMEVVLPEGATLTNVRTADALSAFTTRISDLGAGRYRVLVMAQDGSRIETGDRNNMLFDIRFDAIPTNKADRLLRVNNIILASPEGADLMAGNAHALFAETTAIDAVTADEMLVRGGDDLTIECVKAGTVEVYNLAGQLVTRVPVTCGTTSVNLPMGIYIVAGHKITID
ncbi:MAG: CotH kinase family protein [Bacteroidaceae bacterium]|nr:CotH kinase family protein [Bacteroidaceae bacterium]